jgi:glycosyltransferase involved in cell wall biosynthesis
MRILHLYSDYRWTGPAEPTVNLCAKLKERGHDVLFACRLEQHHGEPGIASRAAAQQLQTITDFGLNRYWDPADLFYDLRKLPKFLRDEKIEVLHTHLSYDHALGGWAARRSRAPVSVVRTNHKAVPLRRSLTHRILIRYFTEHLIEISDMAAAGDIHGFRLEPSRVSRANVALDLARFDPSREKLPDLRAELGLGASEVVIGIVARMQRHRRFDVLLRGFALALKQVPQLRLVVLGRGTHQEMVAKEPARRLGLGDRVLFPGYYMHEKYVAAVNAFDVKVFLMPGSDGSCRAAREAMALGKPVICARRGMLPEIVTDGVTGFVVDDTPENLAAAMVKLALDPERRQSMGQAARAKALREFSPEQEVVAVEKAYEAALSRKRGKRG